MSEPLNIFAMMEWIRRHDSHAGYNTHTMDFLHQQHLSGRIESEDFWHMLKDLMVLVLNDAVYNPEQCASF